MAKTIIAISFTLKGQSLESIREAVAEIAAAHEGEDVLLVHGFLPRETLKELGFGTEVVDMLDEYFPNQANFYSPTLKKVERINMANFLKEHNGKAYIVGIVKEGVEEEADLYKKIIGNENIQFVATDEMRWIYVMENVETAASDIAEDKELKEHPATEGESLSSLTKEEQNDVDGLLTQEEVDLKFSSLIKEHPEVEEKKGDLQKQQSDDSAKENRIGGFHKKPEPASKAKKSSKTKKEGE